jgi:ABC-2 type transport system ATP-binding protein
MLGPNGAGKSTLLKMMSGLEAPDSGSITIQGLEVARQFEQVKRLIGVLPDELGLFESLTIAENLLCVGPIYGLTDAETHLRVDSLLDLLALQRGRNTMVRECSFGMRKKTALAMALLHGPRVLFLDEPFEGVDPASSRAIERTLAGAAERGVTVVLTSHILPLMERLATRVILLGNGRVMWDSTGQDTVGPLETKYFELAREPEVKELSWLG